MTSNTPAPHLRRVLGGLVVLILVAIGSVIASTPPLGAPRAAAATHRRVAGEHGTGVSIKGQWFGSWRVREGLGFCIEFDRDHPDSTGAHRLGGGRVPGMSKEQSARVAYVVGRYARTRSRTTAAAAAIYVWRTQHTTRFDRYYATLIKARLIPARIRHRVDRIAAEAKHHGPYRLRVSIGAGYVGQTISGVATVRGHRGPARRMAVRLAINGNGHIVQRKTRTDRRGRLPFTVRVTRPGPVRVNALLTTPRPGGVWITRATRGHQRLVVAGSRTDRVRASAASQRSPGRPTLRSLCDSDCRGTAPVTVTVRNACGSAVLRELVYRNGRPLPGGTVDVPGCHTRRLTVHVPDGSVITTRYCYLDARRRCTSRPIANAGQLRVVCPAPVQVRFSGSCPCDGNTMITYELRAPAASTRPYVADLTVGRTRLRLPLVNGRWRSFAPVRLAAGSTVRLSVTVHGRTTLLDALTRG